MSSLSLRIGTRGSALALWQAHWIRDQILALFPQQEVELKIIKTQGDQILDRPLAEIGGKGLFVKELETALLANEIDLAVHSMKDVPSVLPEGLAISVITRREDPADALVSPHYATWQDLPQGAIVGTSSLRRAAQLKAVRPDLQIQNLRGNVDTRLRKIQAGEYDAGILACAGLRRLGLAGEIRQSLPFEVMLPAIAQGAVGIETRSQDERTRMFLMKLHHPQTAACLEAERAVLQRLEGNCQIPLAGHCVLQGDDLHLTALIIEPNGNNCIRLSQSAPREQASLLGQGLAEALLARGGSAILAALKS